MSVAASVRKYLRHRPYLIEALESGIANHTSLSRKISKETGIETLPAIKAAVRRFAEKARVEKGQREQRVLQILRDSSILIQDGLMVLISRRPIETPSLIDVKLPDVSVHLLEKFQPIEDSAILARHKECGVFIITSPTSIEETPGVVAYLSSLLAEQDINVVEFVSCYTKTLLVIARSDVSRAYDILSSVVG